MAKKTLAEIQAEEAAEAAAAAAAAEALGGQGPVPGGPSGWAKVAGGPNGASAAPWAGPTLDAPAAGARGGGKTAPWVQPAAATKAPILANFRDIQYAAEQLAKQEQRQEPRAGPPPAVRGPPLAPAPVPAPAPWAAEVSKVPTKSPKDLLEEQKRVAAQLKAELQGQKREAAKPVAPVAPLRGPAPKV